MKEKLPASDIFDVFKKPAPPILQDYSYLLYLEQRETNKLIKTFMFRISCGLLAIWLVVSGFTSFSFFK